MTDLSKKTDAAKKIAIVFPGQGSQTPGMLADFYQASDVFRDTFAQASDVLEMDLWQRVANGTESDLADTVITQTVMLTADIAVWRTLQQIVMAEMCEAIVPIAVAGHSLGEFSALVAAGSLSFPEMLSLVTKRAELMQAAVPKGVGGMAAIIGLESSILQALCEEQGRASVGVANLNAPGQTVIGGTLDAVQKVMDAAKSAGAKRAVLLPMSVPSHCALMKEAAEQFKAVLVKAAFRAPHYPLVHNLTADMVRVHEQSAQEKLAQEKYDSIAQIREALYQQLFSPVRWVESVQRMLDLGADLLLECGPGKVLTGLNKRIIPKNAQISLQSLETYNNIDSVLSYLQGEADE